MEKIIVERTFNIGDHVFIAGWSNEYDEKYRGSHGVVTHLAVAGKCGVKLYGHTDIFWIDVDNLVLQKDGYSYVAARGIKKTWYNTIPPLRRVAEIKKVIFNNPATIILWSDGSKTIVKCSDDEAFDEEKGLAMAISKKLLGNNGNYYNEFKKWLPKTDFLENHDCTSCKYLERSIDSKPCNNCDYYGSNYKPYKPRKGDK